MAELTETTYRDERDLLTGQYVRLRYVLASPVRRLLALMIDAEVLVFLFAMIEDVRVIESFITHYLPDFFQSLIPVSFCTIHLFSEYLWGRSIGKRIMGLSVVSLDGERPVFSQCFLRWVLFPVDCLVVGLILIDRKGGRLGDLASGSLVVVESDKSQDEMSVCSSFSYADPDYVPTYPDAATLSPVEVEAIRAVVYDRQFEVYLDSVCSMVCNRLPSVSSANRDTLIRILDDYSYFVCQR